jgi:hypothetical protein
MPPVGEWWQFVHTRVFDEEWEALGLGDADLARLQADLVADPLGGAVIAGTGGLRKARFAREGEGKSGSLRVCYAFFPDPGVILLVIVYGKSAKADLTPAEKKSIKKLLSEFGARLGSD